MSNDRARPFSSTRAAGRLIWLGDECVSRVPIAAAKPGGADPGAHGLEAAPGQAARRYRRPADDRARAGARRGGGARPRGRRLRRARHRGGCRRGGRARGTHPPRPRLGLGPHLRGAGGDRPGRPARCGGQPAGRPADPRPGTASPGARAAGRPCRRYRDPRGGDRRSGGARGPERGQGRGLAAAGGAARTRPLLHPHDRACRRRGRSGTISASTPTGAARSLASWHSRRARWSGASGSSSYARSRTGCASRSPSSTRFRSASTRRRNWRRRGRGWKTAEGRER